MQATAAELAAAGFESNDELNAFRYTDFAFRAFIEAARGERYFADTLFVFIGDHGIGGDAGTRFPRAWTEQGLTAFHTPLLFYAPGMLEPRRISSVASMVDVLPTIAGIAGIPYRNSSLGRDLLRQEAIDGGRSNVAFIIDHHNQTVGVRRGPWYATRRLSGGQARHDWADPQRPQAEAADPVAAGENAVWIEAMYETSRYLLFNNRKPAPNDAVGKP
jgi:arylsulfatase A-like enzyme